MDESEIDIKTTVLTNLPIVTEEAYPEHILPDDLAVFDDNSDGNLTINTVQQVVEVVREPGEVIDDGQQQQQQQHIQLKHEDDPEAEPTTVYIMQIGEPTEDLEDGEYEEYELCTEEDDEGDVKGGEADEVDEEDEEEEEEEQDDSLVDDPTYGEEDEEQERFDCEPCKKNFKTAAVSVLCCFVLVCLFKSWYVVSYLSFL